MVRIKKNVVTRGFSGKLEGIVFRVKGGKTYVSSAPPEKRSKELTPAQQEHKRSFQEAILYGKSVIADPIRKSQYAEVAQEGQSAFNVAVADFFNAPSIEKIDISKYIGQPGSMITVFAMDDYKVAEVQVAIYKNDGTLVESGLAIQQPELEKWVYTATTANGSLTGEKVIVRASDMPGNLTELSQAL